MKVAVVGGGISGLAAAHFLGRAGHDALCFEASERPGGLMRSERRDGFLCEAGPQGILDGAADVRALIDGVGLGGRVVAASAAARRRYVYVRGALRAVPGGPLSLLSSDVLSAGGKWRLLREPFVKPRPAPAGEPPEDESVLAFGARRLGDEAAHALVAPAVIGIFAGDAARLSLRSALPRLAALEQRHGSLLAGLRAARREGAMPGRLVSFPDGLEELPVAIAGRLGPRLVRARVRGLRREPDGWRLTLEGGPTPEATAEAVVVATPPRATADLLAPLAPGAAAALREIPLAPAAVVCLGFRSSAIGMDLAAYGFLVARGERPTLLGCQYDSSTFPGRAPRGAVLLRAILGGVFEPGVVGESDAALVERTLGDLRIAAGLDRTPDVTAVWRHPAVLPQYEIGHERRVRAVDQEVAGLPGLAVLGMALRGVGVADCIRNAAAAAQALPR